MADESGDLFTSDQDIQRFFEAHPRPGIESVSKIARELLGGERCLVINYENPGDLCCTNEFFEMVVIFRPIMGYRSFSGYHYMMPLAEQLHGAHARLWEYVGHVGGWWWNGENVETMVVMLTKCHSAVPWSVFHSILAPESYMNVVTRWDKYLLPENLRFASNPSFADLEPYYVCIVQELARLFATSWRSPQRPPIQEVADMRRTYERHLRALKISLPEHLQKYVLFVQDLLDPIFTSEHRFVLNHRYLSGGAIFLDRDSIGLAGVSHWNLSAIAPFGEGLVVLEEVLGWMTPSGWVGVPHSKGLHSHFWRMFEFEVGRLSSRQRELIMAARVMGIFLRYAFVHIGPAESNPEVLINTIALETVLSEVEILEV